MEHAILTEVLEERIDGLRQQNEIHRKACQEHFQKELDSMRNAQDKLSEKVSLLDGSIGALATSVADLSNTISSKEKDKGIMFTFWGTVIKAIIPLVIVITAMYFSVNKAVDTSVSTAMTKSTDKIATDVLTKIVEDAQKSVTATGE